MLACVTLLLLLSLVDPSPLHHTFLLGPASFTALHTPLYPPRNTPRILELPRSQPSVFFSRNKSARKGPREGEKARDVWEILFSKWRKVQWRTIMQYSKVSLEEEIGRIIAGVSPLSFLLPVIPRMLVPSFSCF